MIVIDSSVLVAMLLPEHDSDVYLRHIAQQENAYLSMANYVETCVVAKSRLTEEAFERVDRLLFKLDIQLCELTRRQARLARDAFARYGKGRHKAGLNICDCFAYALAKDYELPLLFKGRDFALTDIESAL